MNKEILFLVQQMHDAYEGEPWFGRSIKEMLNEIDESMVFEKPDGQHSILELLWHMNNWKAFAISRFRKEGENTLSDFENKDWRELDHANESLWQQGLQQYAKLHKELIGVFL